MPVVIDAGDHMGFNDVPVIMVTADEDTESLKHAFEASAMDYVMKPFDRLELRVRVTAALKFKHALDAHKSVNALLQEKNVALNQAMESVKVLHGLLPICASCKMIRDDSGTSKVMDAYISDHSEANFSHGICPDCNEKLYPDVYRRLQEKNGGGEIGSDRDGGLNRLSNLALGPFVTLLYDLVIKPSSILAPLGPSLPQIRQIMPHFGRARWPAGIYRRPVRGQVLADRLAVHA